MKKLLKNPLFYFNFALVLLIIILISSIDISQSKLSPVAKTVIAAAQAIMGEGTTNYIAAFGGAYTIGDSIIYDTGTNVGISTTGPSEKLEISTSDRTILSLKGNINGNWVGTALKDTSGVEKWFIGVNNNNLLLRRNGSSNDLVINSSGNVGIGTASPGAKLEVAGQIKITGGSPGNGKVLTSDVNGLASWVALSTGGTVTSITQGTGLTFSPNPITTTGTISLNTGGISTCNNAINSKIIWDSSTGRLTCATDQSGNASLPSGSSGQTLRHDGTNWVANSNIYNNGTNVGIGTVPVGPGYKLDVAGAINLNKGISSGIALNVNGAEALWYDGNYFSWGFGGNYNYFADSVGIGMTPSYKLDVAGRIHTNDDVCTDQRCLNTLSFNTICTPKRGGITTQDSVLWCPLTHPTLSFCNIADDQAADDSATLMSSCLLDGFCDAKGIRGDLGQDGPYLEIIKNAGGRQGCWQYDFGHGRKLYRLQIICCK